MNNYEDGLEVDPEEDQDDQMFVNYDITTYPSDFTLNVLYGMWKNESIIIPDFQRDYVWSINQASLLIDSFLIGLPVPQVFFYIDNDYKNLVIDGQQRLLSIFYYFEGFFGKENERGKRQVFHLSGLNKKHPLYNKAFKELDDKTKRKLENAVLRAINVRQVNPKDGRSSIYYIFERLNTGGTPLKSQEIRNCVYRGDFLNSLRKLNENADWRKILGKSIPDKHQNDVELILRAFGLCNNIDMYEKPMKRFLNIIAEKYQKDNDKKIKDFEQRFQRAAHLVATNFRDKPFSARGPLNTSLFDSIFCTIINNIDKIPDNISSKYETLLEDKVFIDYTTMATSDEKILKKRFEYVQKNLTG
ncbi:DUF262 domain-containing protein [Treponema endosymbiont of Eucomonympha sp.]|uniref:DUF262 domain-containing protein n=1 Tax=Treponema endosymbiont of Eucomonympha sp. TaxID=1580831 RepID=UPI00078078E6|nr:DUF262 domain-containing protein [Treponema endosymbiont of Eucomonympha sp.]